MYDEQMARMKTMMEKLSAKTALQRENKQREGDKEKTARTKGAATRSLHRRRVQQEGEVVAAEHQTGPRDTATLKNS